MMLDKQLEGTPRADANKKLKDATDTAVPIVQKATNMPITEATANDFGGNENNARVAARRAAKKAQIDKPTKASKAPAAPAFASGGIVPAPAASADTEPVNAAPVAPVAPPAWEAGK